MKSRIQAAQLVALIGAFVGLLFFTLLTLGVFSSSSKEAVASALEKSDFSSSYLVVLPKNMMDSVEGVAFTKRFKGNPNKLYICSVSLQQFKDLSVVEGVKSEGMNIKDSPFSVLWFDGSEKGQNVFKVLSQTTKKEKCISTETNNFFYIDGPKTISSINSYAA